MPDRHTRLRHLRIEPLEERGLLSALPAVHLDHTDLLDGMRRAVEVDTTSSDRAGGHLPSDTSGDGSPSHTSREDGTVQASPAARSTSRGGGGSRRLAIPMLDMREILDPLTLEAHRTDPSSSADSTGLGPEPNGAGGEGASEPSVDNSFVGWAPAGATPSGSPSAPAPGSGSGPSGRFGSARGSSSMQGMPPGSLGNVMADLDMGAVAGRIGPLKSVAPDGVAIVDAVTDGWELQPAWEPLLDAALRPDWEGIDREMRNLIGKIGALADAPEARQAGWTRMAWIGVATFLYLSHRASSGRHRVFRPGAPGASHVPISIGPWPLGPP